MAFSGEEECGIIKGVLEVFLGFLMLLFLSLRGRKALKKSIRKYKHGIFRER